MSPWFANKALSYSLALCLSVTPQIKSATNDVGLKIRLQVALNLLLQAEAKQTQFTRYHLEHNVVTHNGGEIANTTKLFEDTWINDLPYERLLEFNGKPLTGKDLTDEQSRYDKTIAERRALGAKERAQLTGGHIYSSNLNLEALAGPGYHLNMSREDDCGGIPCHEFSADPVDSGPDKPIHPRHCEIWIADADGRPVKLSYELLSDDGSLKKGSTGLIEWQTFDGVPVTTHSLYVGLVRRGFQSLRIETDNRYDRYRRFSTSVTISPAHVTGAPQP